MTVRLLQEKNTYTVDYPEAIEFAERQSNIFWLPNEIDVSKDLHDLKTNFTESEAHAVTTTLKLFTLYEMKAGDEYWGGRIMNRFPRPDIQRMANAFSFFELNVHAVFYNKLNEVLGIATDDFYAGYVDNPFLKERMEFIDSVVNDEDDLASLAVFSMVEGAVLYSNFAFLKHFQAEGKNKLVNVCAGINFSVVDECLVGETEVLTDKGWKRLDELSGEEPIAQFCPNTKEVSFVVPDRIVKKQSEELYRFESEKNSPILQVVTPNHRMPVLAKGKEDIEFKLAKDIKYHTANFIPLSGVKVGGKSELSLLERFFIAAQADGSVSNRYTGEQCGTIPVTFSFSKEKKIERLLYLAEELGFNVREGGVSPTKGNVKALRNFRVDVPINLIPTTGIKDFKWVDLSGVSGDWAKEFIDEVSLWDGSINKKTGALYYSSTNESCVDLVQALTVIAGMSSFKTIQVDSISENYNDIHRLFISNKNMKRCGTVKKTHIVLEEPVDVYCPTVPTGAFLVRHEGKVSVTGNCEHSLGGAWLFRELKKELTNAGLFTEKDEEALKEKLYKATKEILEHEKEIISMMFEKGRIEGITEKQLTHFVESRLDICLEQLGYDKVYKPTYNPIASWFYKNINGGQFHDFFVKVGSEYHRDWSEEKFNW